MRHRSFLSYLLIISALLALSGCETLKKAWPFGSKSAPQEQTEEDDAQPERNDASNDAPAKKKQSRYEVLSSQTKIEVDAELKDTEIAVPSPIANSLWPQRGASASNAIGNLKGEKFEDHDSAKIGKGHEWKSVLVTAPVVANGVIYAMDSQGYISAHKADDIDEDIWLSKAAVAGEDKDIAGGGLAVSGEHLFVTTGQSMVFALSVKDGSVLWKRNLGVPVRTAPKIFKGILYVSTIDDQLFALNAASGVITWQHRGLGERVGFLTTAAPAISDNLLVMAYGSGEIYGLAADSGQEIWNDSLSQVQKTSATSSFTGFSADPVIYGGLVFTAAAGNMTAATELISGQRIWDKAVSGVSTPWVAGDYIFQLTGEAQLMAIHAIDGRIKWISALPRFEDKEKNLDPFTWFGPLMVNNELLVFGADGRVFSFALQDGKREKKKKIEKNLGTLPILADGVLYYVTKDAKLHSLKE